MKQATPSHFPTALASPIAVCALVMLGLNLLGVIIVLILMG